eukprot:365707-Chlamydomonas_euryale.AAC.1
MAGRMGPAQVKGRGAGAGRLRGVGLTEGWMAGRMGPAQVKGRRAGAGRLRGVGLTEGWMAGRMGPAQVKGRGAGADPLRRVSPRAGLWSRRRWARTAGSDVNTAGVSRLQRSAKKGGAREGSWIHVPAWPGPHTALVDRHDCGHTAGARVVGRTRPDAYTRRRRRPYGARGAEHGADELASALSGAVFCLLGFLRLSYK